MEALCSSYFVAAITGGARLGEQLCLPRMVIGLLNLKSVFVDGTMSLPFAALGAAEVSTALAVFLTLPEAGGKAKSG